MSVAKMKDGKRWYVFVRYKDWTGETKQHKKKRASNADPMQRSMSGSSWSKRPDHQT